MATEERKPFPTEPEQFDDDTRISFSKASQTYILEDEAGTEWEWLASVKKWTQTISEEEMKQQQEAYKMAGVDEDAPALNPAQKRKQAQLEDPENNPKGPKSGPGATSTGNHTDASHANASNANAAAATAKPNTAVYVTGLPEDTDYDELKEFFKKFGIIAESIDDNKARIKMYADANGNFKGEALIIFHGAHSVPLAEMYDGSPLREQDKKSGPIMSIKPADASYKAHQGNTDKEVNTQAKPKISKAKAKKKAESYKSRLADWSSEDETMQTKTPFSQQLRTVVIKKAFSLNDLEEDEDLLKDLHNDMKEAGEQYGEVKNVTVFDLEPLGIVTIRFSNEESAKKCADALNGRGYNNRYLMTALQPGIPKFNKTMKTDADKEQEEEKRIEEYSKEIDGDD